jgi:LysM repeat protein
MRKLSLLFVLIMLVACSGSDEVGKVNEAVELPTTAAPASIGIDDEPSSNNAADSPRGSNANNESGLPPTFTPMPTSVRELDAVTLQTDTQGTPSAPSSSSSDLQTYTIQAGDTLAEIAASFGVPVETLADANDIIDIDEIEVGQVLRIP